jgi:hypothetical protein
MCFTTAPADGFECFSFIFVPYSHYAEPKTLAYFMRPICLLNAEGGHIASFEPDGRERVIEVKTTNGWERALFRISRNEIAAAESRIDDWHPMRVWNLRNNQLPWPSGRPWTRTLS